MKVVLDSNVLVAAFAFGGICRAIVDVCVDSHHLIISEYILLEVHQVLVSPVAINSDVCRDLNDLPVLGTMLAGKADCLVTGDKDLLELVDFDGRPIWSPRQFWASLK